MELVDVVVIILLTPALDGREKCTRTVLAPAEAVDTLEGDVQLWDVTGIHC